MYYQRSPTYYHTHPYQQNADEVRTLLPHHPSRMSDSSLPAASVRNSTALDRPADDYLTQQPVLHRVWYNGDRGPPVAESPMTSYPRDVTEQTEGVPAMTSPPSPYDCKPPYSYISLIAMAIESFPGRRSIFRYIYRPILQPLYYEQQSAMMKTDAGTCASLSVSLLTTSFRLSNHFLLYTPIDLRFQLYQQSNQTLHSDQPKIYPTVF